MTKQSVLTYIIPYRHDMQRWNNLKRVLQWLNNINGIEVLIVEQDTHSKIDHLPLKVNHIFTKSNMPFNRSWGFNVGIRYTKTDLVGFGDCDLIMNEEDFISSINKLNEYEAVSPYSSVIDMNPQESAIPFDKIYKIERPGRGENDHQKLNLCGGICLFRTESVKKIGGWNEDFIGWGAEDDYQFVKVDHFLKWHENKARCYHLYHDRPAPDMKWYQRNLALYGKIKDLPKEDQARMINSTLGKIGMKNKYDNF